MVGLGCFIYECSLIINKICLIVNKNIIIINYNHIEETRNGTNGGSGRMTTRSRLYQVGRLLGVFVYARIT